MHGSGPLMRPHHRRPLHRARTLGPDAHRSASLCAITPPGGEPQDGPWIPTSATCRDWTWPRCLTSPRTRCTAGRVRVGFRMSSLPAGGARRRGPAATRAQGATPGHANRELAQLDATVETRQLTAAHCGRCHTEQGFLAWLPQLNAGNPGNILKPDGTAAGIRYLTNLGLTTYSVRPVTCNACP